MTSNWSTMENDGWLKYRFQHNWRRFFSKSRDHGDWMKTTFFYCKCLQTSELDINYMSRSQNLLLLFQSSIREKLILYHATFSWGSRDIYYIMVLQLAKSTDLVKQACTFDILANRQASTDHWTVNTCHVMTAK